MENNLPKVNLQKNENDKHPRVQVLQFDGSSKPKLDLPFIANHTSTNSRTHEVEQNIPKHPTNTIPSDNSAFEYDPSMESHYLNDKAKSDNGHNDEVDWLNSAAPIVDQFNSKMLENLEHFLQSPTTGRKHDSAPKNHKHFYETNSPLNHMFDNVIVNGMAPTPSIASDSSDGFSNMGNEIVTDFMEKAKVFDSGRLTSSNSQASFDVAYHEENMMLKHFFKKLLPLLDGHPLSPWPDLALKYCDFDVARSCFISLACIHIYESKKGGNKFYKTGIAHINNTMQHLIQYILANDEEGEITNCNEEETQKRHIRSFVILVLINVHILFAVLETGRSTLIRFLLKVFGSICQEKAFYDAIERSENKICLVVVLSWYDTVSAIVSPDCRLPLCNPEWYGTHTNDFSTLGMMGCPGEVFKAMAQVCVLRNDLHNGVLKDDANFEREFEHVKLQLFKFRDYVGTEDMDSYVVRLKGAQCWALAVYVSLLRLFRTPQRQAIIQAIVHEFIDVYGSMAHDSPTVTQMVWPVYAIGCECVSDFERSLLHRYMTSLYESAQMGTLYSLRWIVEQVWKQGKLQEEILKQWLPPGTDYLPL